MNKQVDHIAFGNRMNHARCIVLIQQFQNVNTNKKLTRTNVLTYN